MINAIAIPLPFGLPFRYRLQIWKIENDGAFVSLIEIHKPFANQWKKHWSYLQNQVKDLKYSKSR